MTWSEMHPLLTQACTDTLRMVGWSTAVTVAAGLPLGVLLVLTDRGGLLRNLAVNRALGFVVNLGRSLPFVILMIALLSFTRAIVGTTIGWQAAVVPLSVGAVPFFARLVETSLREVDHGLVEAVQSMGGSTWTVVRKVLLPESLPSLIAGATTTVVALIGYSAMAGVVGGGGLGDLALRYGYQRFETGFMWVIVAVLAALVTLVQLAGDLAARTVGRRGRSGAPPRLRLLRSARPAAPSTT
ncbi:ABC transporter permease [Streptomyces cocklensis]|uniref:Methionine ABC transporter, permease component n=1 Tax=Actinacidiphila cocklensis TaxID=887465 RepID=A0A9W4GV78_9ACTN|nr:methionine ABC transporter permease [Actinacidiphila cocklensis]MDD1058908.1 ABC transporter permease [Actinacidiphila cocklensis]CAG6396442.1 methionine ABC transporter, permease component [Actinacidiphila cocklensis]